MKLVLATANKNKIIELKKLLPSTIQLISLEDVGITEEIPETGNTLEENAFLKANYVLKKLNNQNLNYSILSDDSGLEVKALNGKPGVNSAIYAGLPKNDYLNNIKLINDLKKCTKRQATFKTVLCFINQKTEYFEGIIKGTIAYEPKGINGFGYDPLFIPQGYRSTFAELSLETKNNLSHRAIAVTKFLKRINELK
jgi:XTP/dITP diphosphohydrolase